MTKTVVVTGAAGNLGRKICDHLAQSGRYDLRERAVRDGLLPFGLGGEALEVRGGD